MRKALLTKTAGLLTFLLVSSMLFPILAFAATHFQLPATANSNGTVTGTVYTDSVTSFDGDGNPVLDLDVTDAGGNVTTTQATYSSFDGTYYHFNINYDASVTFSTYNSLTFTNTNDATVSGVVYKYTPVGGGGGGVFIPPVTSSNGVITVMSGGTVSVMDLQVAFGHTSDITINISDETVSLPASALAAQLAIDADSTVTIVRDGVTYTLPLAVFDFDQLAEDLEADLSEINIVIGIKTVAGDTLSAVQNAAASIGASIIAPVIDFTLNAEANGETVDITSFGNVYVKRTIELTQSADGNNETGVVFNSGNQLLSFVPSTFAEQSGKTIATLLRNSNSIYTVISNSKTFADVSATSFAKDDIDLLASKLIIAGVSDTEFDPGRNIKRSEFAALVVRALGLDTENAPASSFSDLTPGAWYVKEVAAAEAAGLVSGYPDGTFKPDAFITRQELGSLVIRAMNYASDAFDELTAEEQAAALANFSDAGTIGAWAQAELALAVQEGVIFGYPDGTFSPASNATRAETAAMINRFLGNAGFIN